MGLGWEREGGERVICAQRRNRRRPDDTLQARRSSELTFLRSVLQLRIVYFRGFSIDHLFKCDCTSFMKTLHCDYFCTGFASNLKQSYFIIQLACCSAGGPGKDFQKKTDFRTQMAITQKQKEILCLGGFSDLWVPELLLLPPKKRFLAQNMHFWSF